MSFPFAEIEKKLGYVFKDKDLLLEAFTHKTYANRHGGEDNDRLEYLGDAVLGCVIAEWQFEGNARATAGAMTRERQKLVCQNALDSATDGLGVWQYLLYEGTRDNLKGKPKSSLFEAITGAIFTDGGYAQAKLFVLSRGILDAPTRWENPKGDLQEFLQARGQDVPKYKCEKVGPDNAPMFYCTVSAFGENAKGEGKSKREAQQLAAARLLFELQRSK
ncbi:MAG: hypothetical protein IJX88_03740 [Clostridia bacterium]|nr:hypothetical protein [Clostridia bacterium]